MTSDQNKAVIARFPELLRRPEPATIRELFTEDFRLHDVKYPDWPRGHDGAIRMFVQMNSLAPDITWEIQDIFGESDKLCVRWRCSGTRTDSFESRTGDGIR